MPKKPALPPDMRRALKAAREAENLTCAQLAVQLGVDPSTLARWENGSQYPSALALAALRARLPGVGL